MEKKSRTSTLDSENPQDSASHETTLNYSLGSSSQSDSDASSKKKKKCRGDPYLHNSSLWRNLSYIFSTKTSSSANVKVIREKESPIHRLSSFFKHKKSPVNTIKPITNIGISPKGYQVAVSETTFQPDYHKNLAVAIRLPKGTTSGNVAVTVEMDVPKKSADSNENSNDKPMIMKCSEETDSLTVFTGILKLPPNTDVAQLVNMPLYLIDSKEKIVLNAGYKLWHETVINSSEELLIGTTENAIVVDDIRIKLKLEKDNKRRKANESHNMFLENLENAGSGADVMDIISELDETINKTSEKEPTPSEILDFRYDSMDNIEETNSQNTTADNLIDLSYDSVVVISETNNSEIDTIKNILHEPVDQAKDSKEQIITTRDITNITDEYTNYVIEPDEPKTLCDAKAYPNEQYEENAVDLSDIDNDSIDYISELSDVTHIIYDSKGFINELSATKATKDDIKELISDSSDYINELSVENATSANIKSIIYETLNSIPEYEDKIEAQTLKKEINKGSLYFNYNEIPAEASLDDVTNFNYNLAGYNNEKSVEREARTGDINIIKYNPRIHDGEEIEEGETPLDEQMNYNLINYDNGVNEEAASNAAEIIRVNYDSLNYNNKIIAGNSATGDVTQINYDSMDYVNKLNNKNVALADVRNVIFGSAVYNNRLCNQKAKTDGLREFFDDTIDHAREVTDKKASTDIRKSVHNSVDYAKQLSGKKSAADIREIDSNYLDLHVKRDKTANFRRIESDSMNFNQTIEKTESTAELAEMMYKTTDCVQDEYNKQATVMEIKNILYNSIDGVAEKECNNETSIQSQEWLSRNGQACEAQKEENPETLVLDLQETKKEDEHETEFEERSRVIKKSSLIDDQVGFTVSPYPIPVSKTLCNSSTQYSLTILQDDKEVDVQNSLFKHRGRFSNKYDARSSSTMSDNPKYLISSGFHNIAAQRPSQISENYFSENTLWPISSTSTSTQYSSTLLSFPSIDNLKVATSTISENASSVETEWPRSSASTTSQCTSGLLSLNSFTAPQYFHMSKNNVPVDTELPITTTSPPTRYSKMLPLFGNLKIADQKPSQTSKSNASTETQWPLSTTSTISRRSDTLLSLSTTENTNTANNNQFQISESNFSVATEWPCSTTSTTTQCSSTLLSFPSDVASCSNNETEPKVPLNSPSSYTNLEEHKIKVKCVRNALDFSVNSKNINKISLTYKKPEVPLTIMQPATNQSSVPLAENQCRSLNVYSAEKELYSMDFEYDSPEDDVKHGIKNELDKTLELLENARSRLASLTDEENCPDEKVNQLSNEVTGSKQNDCINKENREVQNLDIHWNSTPFDHTGNKKLHNCKLEQENIRRYYEDKDEYYERQRNDVRCCFEDKNRNLSMRNIDVCDKCDVKKNFDINLSGDNLHKTDSTEEICLNESLKNSQCDKTLETIVDYNDIKDPLILCNEYVYDVNSINQMLNTEMIKLQLIYEDMCSKLDQATDSVTNRSSKDMPILQSALVSTYKEKKISDNLDLQDFQKGEQITNSNIYYKTDKELSEERCQTYLTAENDVKLVIKELLKESEFIKETAILQGAREELEPPFSFEFINAINESASVKVCKTILDDMVNASIDLSKGTTDEKNDIKLCQRNEDITDILNILLESVLKKNMLDKRDLDQTEISESNEIIESLNILFEPKENCTAVHMGDENCLNKNKNYLTDCENKQNHINKYITYFCNTTTFNSKIPKTSYSFGEAPRKDFEMHNTVLETSAKPRDGLTITGREHSTRELETSRLFNELLNFNLMPALSSEENVISSGKVATVKADLCLLPYEVNIYNNSAINKNNTIATNECENSDNLENSNSNSSTSKQSMENKNEGIAQNETTHEPNFGCTDYIHKSQKCFTINDGSNQVLRTNLPSTSAAMYKEMRTSDEEEIILNLDLAEETETSCTEPEYFLPIASGFSRELSSYSHQPRSYTIFDSSSSEEELLHSTNKRPHKMKVKDSAIVEIKPKTSIASDSDSGCLMEVHQQVINNSQESQNSLLLLKPAEAVPNIQTMFKNHTEGPGVSKENKRRVSDAEYEGDQETLQIRLPKIKLRYKSKQELNTPQEIADIEKNVNENDMLTRRSFIAYSVSTTSSLLEYEDSSSATQSKSDISIYMQSEESIEVNVINENYSPTPSCQ